MQIRWRIAVPLLGVLLLGIIVLVAVPYLNYLVYPGSRFTVKDASAIIREDRQVDELGSHIRTEADAKAYVEALMKRWAPRETIPTEYEERLARAEYAAVHNPEKLIPESQVANAFTRLMDKWGMPAWTHVSVPELHALRVSYASTVYPKSVPRLPDETIAPSCRPTEALFLLHMLDARKGLPQGQDNRQRNEYINLRRKYFASHPELTFDKEVSDIFSELGIQ